MPLNDYLKQTQRLLKDGKQETFNPNDLISYINRSRREIAMRSSCVRVLTPISGQIISCTVTNGGTGYSLNPTLTITPPDFPSSTLPYPNGLQATARAIVLGGVIQSIDIQVGGAGYYAPTIAITDPTGTGATATLQLSFINQLNQGQEVYPFSSADMSSFPGVGPIYLIRSVSVLYSNWRYSLACPSFTSYQATLRSYPFQYQYVPFYCAQFGQGTNGSFYMYPLPSQAWQMEWDCQCLPIDLVDNLTPEAIPQPWQDAIPFLAAFYANVEVGNDNRARFMKSEFDEYCHRYSVYTRPGRRDNPYGRKFW